MERGRVDVEGALAEARDRADEAAAARVAADLLAKKKKKKRPKSKGGPRV